MTARPVDPPDWIALHRLSAQYQANLASLGERDSDLASTINALSADILIRSQGDTLQIAQRSPNGELTIQPNPLPAVAADAVVAKLFPGRVYGQPILVAGLDQAWLWRQLHEMPTALPTAPGHRVPLYLACFDPLQFWIVLHMQDLRAMLRDPRVMLFVGPMRSCSSLIKQPPIQCFRYRK